MIKRETIVAGKLIAVRIHGAKETASEEKRRMKQKPTAEAVAKINRRNSERELTLKLHHNFSEGDLHVVLTYSGAEPTKEESKKEMRNFLKRLRRYFSKHKELGPLKWILVTEYENKRIHHHMILSKMDTADLDKLWTAGHARPTHLDGSGDYRKLSAYLIKETDKTFRDDDAFSKQRYSCSRTVVTPPMKVEEVSAALLVKDPKSLKGYVIIEDSMYKGINPVTNLPYMEYMMIATDTEPRLKRWSRGKKKKYREKYYDKLLGKISEKQLFMEGI